MIPVASCTPFPFFAPCDDTLAMLVYATHWLSMHLYTLAYMFMQESCLLMCRPCFNIMKLWTFDPNLHLSLTDTTFCSFSCLFVFLLICLLSYFFACHAYHACSLYAFSYALCIFSFHCLSAGFLFLPLHVHTWSEDIWSEGMVSQSQAKRAQTRACKDKPSGIFSRFRNLAFPFGLCTL